MSTLSINIGDCERIGPSIYRADLTPADVRAFGRVSAEAPGRSVVIFRNILEGRDGVLSVFPTDVLSIIVGTLSRAILISANVKLVLKPPKDAVAGVSAGDVAFIVACRTLLKKDIAAIGEKLLNSIRQHHNGELVEGMNRKWINRPHNFFTIIPQIRNQSYRISIRGRPDTHSSKKITLADGMAGYSEFILRSASELDDAVSLILEAARRG